MKNPDQNNKEQNVSLNNNLQKAIILAVLH